MPAQTTRGKSLAIALGFLAPNIIGVLTFVVFPVLFSILLAFSDWNLRRHNMFQDEPLSFVWLENFQRLIMQGDFLRYLGNTLFLMMGIPFSVGGSLLAAVLLSKDTTGGGARSWGWLVAGALVVTCGALLVVLGAGATAMTLTLVATAGGILVLGVAGGTTVYRTLFYTPFFVQGVATFLLWKKLYNPESGPINTALRPVLEGVAQTVNTVPDVVFTAGLWVCFGLLLALQWWGLSKLRGMWRDGEVGSRALAIPAAFLLLPVVLAMVWGYTASQAWVLVVGALAVVGWQGCLVASKGRDFACEPMGGAGTALMLGLTLMVGELMLLGLAPVLWNLPAMASDGLEPPMWIHDYHWAKPSLMLMALWGAIGSNNMLLYLAALTNVPQDLYEAADIDGAGRFQKFWSVTWPQLAPTTFFIAVMATIGGLQGGFEMARTMTEGGPAGATTTLSYFIFEEGFETGRLSFASATAWVLFLLVFSITMFNWKFGNKYVND